VLKHTYYSRRRPFWLGAGSRMLEDLPPDGKIEYIEAHCLPDGVLGGVRTSHPLSDALVTSWDLEEV